ncbi:MAG: DUF892 family protein [Magnetospirillum sp.]|nr:DUF892 family protein [Magnetospirillum sp.]
MADTRDILIDWLKDAHAMERACIDNLERQVEHFDHYPDVKAMLAQHLEMTRRQEDLIDEQLDRIGADKSRLKDVVTRFAGRAQALLAGASADEVVKQTASTAAYEEWEASNFRALAAAADHEGEQAMRVLFEGLAAEKQRMCDQLSGSIPSITQAYLDRRAAGSSIGAAKS